MSVTYLYETAFVLKNELVQTKQVLLLYFIGEGQNSKTVFQKSLPKKIRSIPQIVSRAYSDLAT